MNKKAIILLAEGFEEIEAITCINILRRAKIKTLATGISSLTVTGSRKIKIKADTKINQSLSSYHACILPGGMPGAQNIATSPKAIKLIKEMAKKQKIIAAICASPAVVLSPLGLLDNKIATCYPEMKKNFSHSTTYKNKKVVVDRNIITSQGPATAFAFALKVVEELSGKKMSRHLKASTLYQD